MDGWIVARMLFGGARFEPLDRLAFIREAGHMPAFIALSEDPSLGVCAGEWAEENPDAIDAYHAWYNATYRGEALAAESEAAAAEEDGSPDEAEPREADAVDTGTSGGS